MAKLWKKLDTAQFPPIKLNPSDECYFAREYISHGGYQASDCNRFIANFKKLPTKRGLSEWQYKEAAIKKFAMEVASVLDGKVFSICTIPTSKVRGSEGYDNRFDEMILELKRLNPKVIYEEPITTTKSVASASKESGSRDPDDIYQSYKWMGFSDNKPSILIVIDDVVTTGGHFRAYKRMIQEQHPEIRVIGLFWAMTVWPVSELFDLVAEED